jgi:hypothetical protein
MTIDIDINFAKPILIFVTYFKENQHVKLTWYFIPLQSLPKLVKSFGLFTYTTTTDRYLDEHYKRGTSINFRLSVIVERAFYDDRFLGIDCGRLICPFEEQQIHA